MTTVPSANNQDPTLFCEYFGGPKDGFRTGDLPEELSGTSLQGTVMRSPLSEPHLFSLFAVYECTSETQVNGFWPFTFVRMEGPNGETLVAAVEEPADVSDDPADLHAAGP